MFGRSKGAKARTVAEDAWDALASTWESARDRTGDLVEGTQEKMTAATDEARRRASAALDALAGRRPSTPWALLLAAVAAGAAVGWIAAAAIGRSPGLAELERSTEADATDVTTRG